MQAEARIVGMTDGGPFVGRSHELGVLTRGPKPGEISVHLVVGPPGIGKSRLLAESVARLPARTIPLWIRFREQDRSAFTALAAALDEVASQPAVAEIVDQMALAPELGQLSPRLAEHPGTTPETTGTMSLSPERLATATVRLLDQLHKQVSMVVLADDLHWAHAEMADLLRDTIGECRLPHFLAKRDSHHFNRPVDDLLSWVEEQDGLVDQVTLVGLEPKDISAYLEQRFGHPDSDGVAAGELCAQTNGNPFLVREVIEDAHRSGDLTFESGSWRLADRSVLPQKVHEIMSARLARVDHAGREVLDMLALAGTPVPLRVLHQAIPQLTPGLSRAEHLGMVTIDLSTGSAALRHDFIRQHVEANMRPGVATDLHDRLAQAFEHHDPQRWSMEIAHHHLNGTCSDPDRAISAARTAATSALGELSLSRAADHLAAARDLAKANASIDIATELDLAILEGDIRRRIGDRSHRRLLLDAAAMAEASDDPGRTAEAALAFCRIGQASVAGIDDREASELARRALRLLGDEDSAVKARLLAALSHIESNHPSSSAESHPARDHYDKAEAIAHRLGDPEVLSEVLGFAYWALDTFDDIHRCEEIGDLLISLAPEVGPRAEFEGERMRFAVAVQANRPGEARASNHRMGQIAQWLGEATEISSHEYQNGTLAIIDGDLAEVERAADEYAAMAQRADIAESRVVSVYGSLLAVKGWLTNSLRELTDVLQPLAVDLPGIPAWPLAVALAASQEDDVDQVGSIFDEVCGDDFADIPRDFIWSITMAVAGHAVARVGLGPQSRLVHEQLAPHAGLMTWGGSPTLGPVDQVLGETALAFGDPALAQRWFRSALETAERWDSPTFRSMARVGLVEAILCRADAGPSAAGEGMRLLDDTGPLDLIALLDSADTEANAHGIELVRHRVRRLRDRLADRAG